MKSFTWLAACAVLATGGVVIYAAGPSVVNALIMSEESERFFYERKDAHSRHAKAFFDQVEARLKHAEKLGSIPERHSHVWLDASSNRIENIRAFASRDLDRSLENARYALERAHLFTLVLQRKSSEIMKLEPDLRAQACLKHQDLFTGEARKLAQKEWEKWKKTSDEIVSAKSSQELDLICPPVCPGAAVLVAASPQPPADQ